MFVFSTFSFLTLSHWLSDLLNTLPPKPNFFFPKTVFSSVERESSFFYFFKKKNFDLLFYFIFI